MRGGLTVAVGVILVIAGLSGTYALKGTESPGALVLFGVGAIIFGVVRGKAGATMVQSLEAANSKRAAEYRKVQEAALRARGSVAHEHSSPATDHSFLQRHLDYDHGVEAYAASTIQMRDQHAALHPAKP